MVWYSDWIAIPGAGPGGKFIAYIASVSASSLRPHGARDDSVVEALGKVNRPLF
jgi:hypothetical protein